MVVWDHLFAALDQLDEADEPLPVLVDYPYEEPHYDNFEYLEDMGLVEQDGTTRAVSHYGTETVEVRTYRLTGEGEEFLDAARSL